MNRIPALFIACLFFALSLRANAQESACSVQAGKATVIQLQSQLPASGFYYRSGSYVVFLGVEPVTSYLLKHSHSTVASWLLKEIESGLPLNRTADLFGFVLTNNTRLRHIELLIADALEQGKATVIHVSDLWPTPSKFTAHIMLYKPNDDIAGFRVFCTADGDDVYSVLDYIA